MQQQSNEDRLSNLPDPILHQIFSSVDTKVLVQSTIFSYRWKYLWKSINTITLNLDTYTTTPNANRIDFVDKLLLLRDNINIHKFSLSCRQEFNARRLCIWLLALLRLRVQELYLDVNLVEFLDLPQFFFGMDIKKMRLGKYGMFGIQLPNSMCSAGKLRSLELVVVRFPEGDADGKLVLSCPVLENLVMIECEICHLEILIIALPKLESMEFVDEYDRGGDCQINVCTPKLKSFKFVGPFFGHVWLENTPCLVSADIDAYQIKYYEIDKDLYLERLVRILTGMAYLKAVTMSASLLKTLTKLPILGWIAFIFRNVKCMELTNQWDDETCICPIANILEKLPHIEALVLERNKILRGPYDMVERLPFLSHSLKHEELHKRCDSCICAQLESLPSNEALLWEKNKEMWLGSTNNAEALPSECLFDCLKTIEIRNPQGTDDDLKLMAFLLKRAVALEKVIITTTGQLSIERMNKMTEFNERLLQIPPSSSSVLIDSREL